MAVVNSFRVGLRQAYDGDAQRRDGSSIEPWKAAERAEFLARLLGEHKRNLLEIGAGPGRDAQFFCEHGLNVVCVDLSHEMVKRCQQKGLAACVCDMSALPFPPRSFDAIFALNSFLHLAKGEMPTVLRCVAALLQPKGLFYLGLYGGEDFQGPWEKDWCTPHRFFSFYTDDHLRQTVAEVFDILNFKCVTLGGGSDLHFQSLTLRRKDLEAG